MRVNTSRDLIDMDDSLLKNIVTSDETWCAFLTTFRQNACQVNGKQKHQGRKNIAWTKAVGKCDVVTEGPLKKWIPGVF
ncbi:hypothetical protein TNCV_4966321 [Trichonephila clavipes]|nr:hypothetical protein TNCV_4966321 [Trichonephila clavipes]